MIVKITSYPLLITWGSLHSPLLFPPFFPSQGDLIYLPGWSSTATQLQVVALTFPSGWPAASSNPTCLEIKKKTNSSLFPLQTNPPLQYGSTILLDIQAEILELLLPPFPSSPMSGHSPSDTLFVSIHLLFSFLSWPDCLWPLTWTSSMTSWKTFFLLPLLPPTIHSPFSSQRALFKKNLGSCLVVQWLRVCLAMQGCQGAKVPHAMKQLSLQATPKVSMRLMRDPAWRN